MSNCFPRLRLALAFSLLAVTFPLSSGQVQGAALPAAPALSNIASVSVGTTHACAVDGAGALYCWGSNATGQLGVSGIPYSDIPVRVTGMGSGVASVSAGSGHTCALTTSATVKCWGSNTNGQLGNGSTIDSPTAVNVSGLSGVTALSAGTDYTCAVANGAARCWGWNDYRQLGDSTGISRTTPITVNGLSTGVTGIAAGYQHTCAVLAGGGARCWGWNSYGQLGDWSTNPSAVPVAVNMAGSASAIAVGSMHSCALMTTGGVQCWGMNVFGQVGHGSPGNTGQWPGEVSGLSSGATSISAGGMMSCAIVNGGAKCWGINTYGSLGDGTTTSRSVPTDVSGLTSGVLGLSAGGCAITADGRVMCWGSGILGNGTSNGLRYAPSAVVGLEAGVSAIGAGQLHTCAATNTGSAVCWGQNANGQLGDGTTVDSNVPVTVSGLVSGVVALGGGWYHSCALLNTGGVKCWGMGYGLTPVDVPDLSFGAISLSVGGYHACVIMTTGAARCWGTNQYGQLGDDSLTSRTVPVTVTEMTTGTLAIAAGSFHTCAIVTTGGVRCWGYGYQGGLGNGTTTSQQKTPVDVTGITSGATAVAAGLTHSCAIVSGVAWCWGYNLYGSLGDGTRIQRTTPVLVIGAPPGLVSLIRPGAYASQTCAIGAGGAAYCWGANYNAQVGDGSQADRLTATPVANLSSGVTEIVGGYGHTCALTAPGAVKCWGSRLNGQVGDGTWGFSAVPVYVGNPLPLNPIRTFIPALHSTQ